MKKKTIAILLIIICVLQSSAFATCPVEEEQNASLMASISYQDLVSAYVNLSVTGTAATYSLDATGNTDVKSMSASLQLQRGVNNEWVNYGQAWTASSSSRFLFTSGTKDVPTGYVWRLKVTITCYKSGSSSQEIVYS